MYENKSNDESSLAAKLSILSSGEQHENEDIAIELLYLWESMDGNQQERYIAACVDNCEVPHWLLRIDEISFTKDQLMDWITTMDYSEPYEALAYEKWYLLNDNEKEMVNRVFSIFEPEWISGLIQWSEQSEAAKVNDSMVNDRKRSSSSKWVISSGTYFRKR